MARAALRILHHRFRAKRLDNRGNRLGLMSNNDDDLSRLQRLASPHDMLDQRAPARAMQHLGHVGFEARAFPGSEYDGDSVFRGHCRIILASPPPFGKSGEYGRVPGARVHNSPNGGAAFGHSAHMTVTMPVFPLSEKIRRRL